MAMILSFTPRTAPASRPPTTAEAPAAVIIFPGVRYEHRCDAERAAAAPGPAPLDKSAPRH